ncbi:MAG: hypothetical protein Q9157_000082 [Trypethelium eluteriae]
MDSVCRNCKTQIAPGSECFICSFGQARDLDEAIPSTVATHQEGPVEFAPIQNPIEQDGGQLSTNVENSLATVPAPFNEGASTYQDAVGGHLARNPAVKRGKAEFSAEQLSEALPKDVEEFRDAFRGIQGTFLRQKKGWKCLPQEKINRIIGIQQGTVLTKDAPEKYNAMHLFRYRAGGPNGFNLVRMMPHGSGAKATKDNRTKEDGYVVPTEDWFDVFWAIHDSLHEDHSCGRDATMRAIRDAGYGASIPREVIHEAIDRCPDPKCRRSSRLQRAQQRFRPSAVSRTRAPLNREDGRSRRQHKLEVRSQRSAEAGASSTQERLYPHEVPLEPTSHTPAPCSFPPSGIADLESALDSNIDPRLQGKGEIGLGASSTGSRVLTTETVAAAPELWEDLSGPMEIPNWTEIFREPVDAGEQGRQDFG